MLLFLIFMGINNKNTKESESLEENKIEIVKNRF